MFSDVKKKIRRKIELYNFKRNHRGLYVDGSLQLRLPKYISCGSNIAIGENSKLLCWDSYDGKKFETSPSIIIGSGVRITRNLTIQCANRVQIGDNVLIASDVFIIDYNHGNSPLTKNYRDNPLNISVGGVTIENGVWIGNNVIILPNVTIGEKSIVGAGSVVTKSIPAYSVAVGNPAHVIKHFDFETNIWIED